MNIKNLHFFDNDGYNLNFDWNSIYDCWEGYIYLPKVSVGLYANTTIYVLEEIKEFDNVNVGENNTMGINFDTTVLDNTYYFPQADNEHKSIHFTWDRLNTFVDEFFMFNFDETYILKETSSLTYTPNDGPDCETLIINRFDRYDVRLDNNLSSKALPIHVAFMANEKYDATTYNRTLIMSSGNKTIARIKFFAETVEEDERLKIWNSNLGYNITPEDTLIFYKSDIKEYRPNYILLNEKRKELMMEGSNIYPYIGSYKAIVNAIKFFGYNNLNIIEYWKNVNPEDDNFGKIYHSSKYSLTKQETLRIGARNIVLPNKDYKKINSIALVYTINEPTGKIDVWELPEVEEQFTYTIEEATVKLFALRKKLDKEFMPGSSRIVDIIGEASYFSIQGLTKIHDESVVEAHEKNINPDFGVEPSQYAHITDNEYFNRYISLYDETDDSDSDSDSDLGESIKNKFLSDIFNTDLSQIINENVSSYENKLETLSNNELCNWYNEYYREVFVDYTVYKEIQDNDVYPYSYDDDSNPHSRFSAKFVLTNTTFKDDITFDDCDLKFGCDYNLLRGYDDNTLSLDKNKDYVYDVSFGDIDSFHRPTRISWTISMSRNQVDEELKNIGVKKEYKYFDLSESSDSEKFKKTCVDINEYNQFFVELPYIGYYDVEMELFTNSPYKGGGNVWWFGEEKTDIPIQDNVIPEIKGNHWWVGTTDTGIKVKSQKKVKRKFLKVEPYTLELIGYYYDARELPDAMKYDNPKDSVMYSFIKENIEKMYGWATAERTYDSIDLDFSMPYYADDEEKEFISPGPYLNHNIDNEWYLADNLSVEMAKLKPIVEYTRYIRNGVDVKPYTWFLLGYEYSKVAGKVNPKWSITNHSTGITKTFEGKYLTMLLKKEGNYTVNLTLEDKNGNKYEISRNILVVKKSANYKLYQTFKKDYDFITEQKLLRGELEEYYLDDKEDVEEE